MKIVIAPDSFKESLSAAEAAAAMAQGARKVFPQAELLLCPMADGGEGTVSVIVDSAAGALRKLQVRGPLGDPVIARWGWLPAARTAFIEVAQACGLHLVEESRRDATAASSYGCGQLMRAALDAGAEKIVLGLGGTSTTDGGSGMLSALGARLLDAQGCELASGGGALERLQAINLSSLDVRLRGIVVEVASDVDNPLCGDQGAAAVYGPQKGASPAQVAALDRALRRYADVAAQLLGRDEQWFAGSGAAGGIGFAARAFLGASFHPGSTLVAELIGLPAAIHGADLVLTGEGRLDRQSLRGKTPFGVASIAARNGVPVLIIAGMLGEGYQEIYAHGVDAALSLVPGPISLAQAKAGAAEFLCERTEDVLRAWNAGYRAARSAQPQS